MLEPGFQFSFLALLYDILVGVGGVILILLFHGTLINHVLMRFENMTANNLVNKEYHWVFVHFYISFAFIALIHFSEILIWALIIHQLELLNNVNDAILFAGSCYTTLGLVSDILPDGSKSLAFIIAFSGLFSLAWTTSIMIEMTETYRKAWKVKRSENTSL
jgi:hypothetical protein